jgi:hypothetical protein
MVTIRQANFRHNFLQIQGAVTSMVMEVRDNEFSHGLSDPLEFKFSRITMRGRASHLL